MTGEEESIGDDPAVQASGGSALQSPGPPGGAEAPGDTPKDAANTDPTETDPTKADPSTSPAAQPSVQRLTRLVLGTPRGVHPLLFVFAGLSGLAYAWGSSSAGLEPYYAAAVRSMSTNWHNFFFAAVDPAGTISVDKLPGALWLQALSVRLFGLHVWAIVLPQVVEGVLAVFVLYRAVARLASPLAGLVAAGILAASPATVALDRGNVSDSLLTLLVVLAASAAAKALTTGRWRSLLLAGLWVGLAFQAKMIQAWVVLPALGLAYAIAGPPRLGKRLGQLGVAGVLCGAVSFSWMVAISLVPERHRPFVDGSIHDSIFEQVFQYNGIGRFTHSALLGSAGTPTTLTARVLGPFLKSFTLDTPASWHRLLSGAGGRDTAWLVPIAVLSAVAVLVVRRREPRTDPLRAAAILWATWLVLHFVLFSTAESINAYYLGVLSPALAALCACGFELVRHERGAREAPFVRSGAMLGGLALSTVYALWLLDSGDQVAGWVRPAVIWSVAGVGIVVIASALARQRAAILVPLAAAALAACVLVAPSGASASLVSRQSGPFDTPFESLSTGAVLRSGQLIDAGAAQVMATFEQFRGGARYVLATQTSLHAASFIFVTGDEILPIGGFTGAAPSPTLSRLKHLVDTNQLRFVLAAPSRDPRLAWIQAHCRNVTPRTPPPGVPVPPKPLIVDLCTPPSPA